MAEMVVWRKRKKKAGMLDAKRFSVPMPSNLQWKRVLAALSSAAPGFLLALSEPLDMPAGLHAAYIAALAALGLPIHWPMLGAGAAMALRLLSGLDPRWEGLITLGLLCAGPCLLSGQGNLWICGFSVISLLPMAIRGGFMPTAADMLLSWASVAFSALCAPVMARGIKALSQRTRDGRPAQVDTLEGRLGVSLMALMTICGGARLLFIGMNAGMLMAAGGTLLMALHYGAGIGGAAGILTGMILSLMGLPMVHALSLAAAGFAAGAMQAAGRRRLSCAAFALVALIPMIITKTTAAGCGMAVIASSGILALLPRRLTEELQRFLRRFIEDKPQSGDAYAASMLAAWEKTVDAMALAIPTPVMEEEHHDGGWWAEHLCEGCPEPGCTCMLGERAAQKANDVWDYRGAEEHIWQTALEGLRGLGCQRLYQLRQSMEDLRREDIVQQRALRRSLDQRNMLVTHLSAMAGAARRFAHCSTGENWWDAAVADRIRKHLSDAAMPARLSWVRRVQGHVQAAFELQVITGARRQAEELCGFVAAVTGVPMTTASVDGDRIRLTERPPMEVVYGIASASITEMAPRAAKRKAYEDEAEQTPVCGDTAWCGSLQDGRCMAALSDGMGHGETAALASRQTVELLRLCLDAGYTLQQALTAVNGMMLLGGQGERFTTVDLLTIDLWTGEAVLEKLGAACSWLHQSGSLRQVIGDALPLGILESIQSGESMLRLRPDDSVILMTDGIEDAFPSRRTMEDAILEALLGRDAQLAAEAILKAALEAGGNVRKDDQTVLVLTTRTVQDA